MENLNDYSNYVFAAYGLAAFAMSSLMLFVVVKYWSIKSKNKNEKSA